MYIPPAYKSPPPKNKKNEKKMPLIYKYSGTDQHAHMILESGMVNTPPLIVAGPQLCRSSDPLPLN